MKLFQILIAAFCVASCKKAFVEPTKDETVAVPWNDTSAAHPNNAAFTSLIEKYRVKGLPGIALLVRDKSGTWVGATGLSDVEHNIPFGVGQVSKVASITKLFMGALIFKLIEDSANTHLGYHSLFQNINTWLPRRITDKLPNGNNITLGDCMKHETGIPDLISEDKFYLGVLNKPNKAWNPEDLLSFVYNKEPLFKPRDTAIYSSTNTILVAMIMEAATGRKHNELLQQYILDPLHLQHTFYQPHDELPATVAQGYFDLYNNGKIVNVSNLIPGSGWGYNGIYSNLFDLYTFIDALLLKKTLLSAKSLQVMQSWGKPDFPNQYGYGIMKKFIDRGVDAGIGHSGRDLGYSANLFYFPNKDVVHIFLINYGSDSESGLRQTFYDFQDELLNLTLK